MKIFIKTNILEKIFFLNLNYGPLRTNNSIWLRRKRINNKTSENNFQKLLLRE